MTNETKEQKEKLLQVMRDAVQQEKALRDKYQIGEKFRFLRDRLNALLSSVEESLSTIHKEVEKKSDVILEDETLVYVYLFNAQGLVFTTWQKMLNPSVFYEYSVNRPIYTDKSFVEAFIRTKPKKVQHGYLTIAVKKEFILSDPGSQPTDAIGNPLIKVKEGALQFNKMISFTQNEHEYVVNEDGEIVRKVL